MINREDMLELTRRMNLKRTCFTRIAGCYFDADGDENGTFNVNFLNLTAPERTKHLKLAKTVPFSETNVQLTDQFVKAINRQKGSVYFLLSMIQKCQLKNDALLENFYELLGETYRPGYDWGLYIFHGAYDIPRKGSDGQFLQDSEEVYDFIIGVIAPVDDDYEPTEPEYGFLFPAYRDRCGDPHRINVFESIPDMPHEEITQFLLGKL